ncbi:MAG: NADH-quinone oxidoreductase subunit NuoK [Polyangiaceae bacterium]|nr:NADH-quinone oxidoreductase subunit NuoK [Polyangiaceae bacterium]
MMPLTSVLLLSMALFCIGVFGVLSRRNAIGILLGVELMANAVNINLVAFSRFQGGVVGQVFAVFAIALTVAEVVVGLALVILLYRSRKDVRVDEANALSG